MEYKESIEVSFKGQRNYVQGPDIFNKVTDILAQKKIHFLSISMTFNKMARTNIDLYLSDQKDSLNKEHNAYFEVIKDENVSLFGSIVENGDPITSRNEYPEEEIFSLAKINKDSQTISLLETVEYSNTEIIVSLNKRLLQQLYPDKKGKWLFTRFEVSGDITNSYKDMVLILKKNMNFKLTKTEILLDGESVGFIYFSMINQN
ncbi:hypothetical protein [Maribellus mangrovi]|uniref:hypothetical protein n=1 Tax=Maribellus mangrovi TaxID=3133146 RepID=UPI0030EC6D57